MKNDINLLDENFKSEIVAIGANEKSIRELLEKNKKKIEVIKEIRLNKINEINTEIKKNNEELDNLKKDLESLLVLYCQKKGHHYVLIDYKELHKIDGHSFEYGFAQNGNFTYKCTICGSVTHNTQITYRYPKVKKYTAEIPTDIYQDNSLLINGKTCQTIQEKIDELNNYIAYLNSLKTELCRLFGHDAKMIDYDGKFTCNCCGKRLYYQEYINSYYAAKCKKIVPFYYDKTPEIDYVISSPEELVLSLPSFQEYRNK